MNFPNRTGEVTSKTKHIYYW